VQDDQGRLARSTQISMKECHHAPHETPENLLQARFRKFFVCFACFVVSSAFSMAAEKLTPMMQQYFEVNPQIFSPMFRALFADVF
jgi:hypothetical protein